MFSARSKEIAKAVVPAPPDTEAKHPMYVLYGSNTGTSESFAQRIATNGASYGMSRLENTSSLDLTRPVTGFRATMGTLDTAADHLPTDGPVIIVCASFEGRF